MSRRLVADLSGALLDAAVARAEGEKVDCIVGVSMCLIEDGQGGFVVYPPSTEWEWGGLIIERERISLHFEYDPDHPQIWHALTRSPRLIQASVGVGETALIAAMRAYATSKLGPEVEL